jgi:hypothetical protein
MNALLDAFDYSSLQRMLAFRIGVRLEDIVGLGEGMRATVFELMQWADRQGKLEDLIVEAHRFNPSNARLAAFYDQHVGKPAPAAAVQPPAPTRKVKTPIFSQAEILEIDRLLGSAGLVTEETLQALQGGMNLEFRASLPNSGVPRIRLLNTLHILNSTGELIGGEIPFETFLTNAVHLAGPRPESADFKALRQRFSQ